MGQQLSVTHSLFDPRALAAAIAERYDIGAVTTCRLYQAGLSDCYDVTADRGRYLLRVSPSGTAPAALTYETALIRYVASDLIPVALPAAAISGEDWSLLPAPEGERPAVLFQFPPGRSIPADDERLAYQYGRHAAKMHGAMDHFEAPVDRPLLGLATLLDEPLAAVRPFLDHRPKDLRYLERLAGRLRRELSRLAGGLTSGICHGDLRPVNAWDDDGHLTITGFDNCGPGWRALDLARFRRGLTGAALRRYDPPWVAFINGYGSITRPSDNDLEAHPLLVITLMIAALGKETDLAGRFGTAHLNDTFWGIHLKRIKTREKAMLE